MKEKMKNKFKSKLLNLEIVYNTKLIKNNDIKVYESCIFCLKPIEENSISTLYGKVGSILNDFIYLNTFRQTIKEEFIKYNRKNI